MKPINAVTALLCVVLFLISGCAKVDPGGSSRKMETSDLECLVATDFYVAHFTAYLEPSDSAEAAKKTAFTAYCHDLPAPGKSHLTADLLDADAREIPVSVRVLEQVADGTATEVMATPAKIYPEGIVRVVAHLPRKGQYLIELGMGDMAAAEDTIRIPLRVGMTEPSDYRLPTLAVAFTMIGGIVFVKRRRRRTHAAKD